MKILYFVNHPIGNDDGVVKKVQSQVQFFERNGAKAKVLAFSENGLPSKLLKAHIIKTSALKSRLFLYYNAVRFVREFNPDVIYARYDTFIFTQFVLKFVYGYKIVFEINTYDLFEAKLLYKRTRSKKELMKYLVYFLTRKIWLNTVAEGLVFVTEDLKLKYNKIVNERIPSVSIPNSLDCEMFGRDNGHKIGNKELFFIGTPNQPWHGIDKLVDLAERLPDFTFNIIGSNGEDSDNLKYHGYMSYDEYIKIYDKSFACIGPLAIERYGLNQSSPLKVREYIALGKPVIFGYDDFPLSGIISSNFCRLSNIECDWADEIRSFYGRLNVMESYDKNIISLIDSRTVEFNRYEFIRAII